VHRGYTRIRKLFEAAGMTNRATASTAATALFAGLALARSVTVGPVAQREATTDPRDWPVYGGNTAGTRYSPLDKINRGNVAQLRVAWQFDPMDTPPDSRSGGGLQFSPIVIAGTVYSITPGGRLVALDGATGAVRWSFDS